MTIHFDEAYVKSEVEHMHKAMLANAQEYNRLGEFSSEDLARIDHLECELDHAKSGAAEIIVKYLELDQIQDLVEGLCDKTLNDEDLGRLGAVLRAMHMLRHELMALAKGVR
jgi:hypothetical protein